MANNQIPSIGVLCLDASSVGYSIQASMNMIDNFNRIDIPGELDRLSGVLRSTLALVERLTTDLENLEQISATKSA